MSGVEEGGGEPSSGIPPTKKAPTEFHRSEPSWLNQFARVLTTFGNTRCVNNSNLMRDYRAFKREFVKKVTFSRKCFLMRNLRHSIGANSGRIHRLFIAVLIASEARF